MSYEQSSWGLKKSLTQVNGLYFATALSGFNNDKEIEEDPRYATVRFDLIKWEYNENQTMYSLDR